MIDAEHAINLYQAAEIPLRWLEEKLKENGALEMKVGQLEKELAGAQKELDAAQTEIRDMQMQLEILYKEEKGHG